MSRGNKLPVNDKRQYYRTVYLKSEHWKKLKAEMLRRHPSCDSCGAFTRLDVHHLAYRNLYDVQLGDLVVLCRPCHRAVHKRLEEVRKGLAETRQIRREKRAKRRKEEKLVNELKQLRNTKPKKFQFMGPRIERQKHAPAVRINDPF